MITLLVLLVILQGGFHWIFTPLITFSTNIFELRSAMIFMIIFLLWIFSNSKTKSEFKD